MGKEVEEEVPEGEEEVSQEGGVATWRAITGQRRTSPIQSAASASQRAVSEIYAKKTLHR